MTAEKHTRGIDRQAEDVNRHNERSTNDQTDSDNEMEKIVKKERARKVHTQTNDRYDDKYSSEETELGHDGTSDQRIEEKHGPSDTNRTRRYNTRNGGRPQYDKHQDDDDDSHRSSSDLPISLSLRPI